MTFDDNKFYKLCGAQPNGSVLVLSNSFMEHYQPPGLK